MIVEIGLAIQGIKAANEAIGAIKEMCGNIESVGQMGSHLTKLADAKESVKKKAAEGDMDAFMALEEIKNQEAEIKRTFIYQGRPGLWDDYCKFMQTRKELRENERKRIAKEKARKKRMFKEAVTIIAVILGSLTVIGAVAFMLYWVTNQR
jgi:hypothetical protein